MLSRWTFQYAPARRIVEEYIHGRTMNTCAGKTKLQHHGEIVGTDLNPERDADTHLDVTSRQRATQLPTASTIRRSAPRHRGASRGVTLDHSDPHSTEAATETGISSPPKTGVHYLSVLRRTDVPDLSPIDILIKYNESSGNTVRFACGD